MRATVRAALLAISVAIICLSVTKPPGASDSVLRTPSGYPQLLAIQDLPDNAEMCLPETMPAKTESNLFAETGGDSVHAAAQDSGTPTDITRPPVRTVFDSTPIYSSLAVDMQFDEVVLQDTNSFSIKVFNRLENTLPGASPAQPKRIIAGRKTTLEYYNGIYVDPKTGDISTVASDQKDNVLTFARDASGDVAPVRELKITHRGYAMAVDEDKQEMYVSIQYPPRISVYRKGASGTDKPLRQLEGETTRLSDVHGMVIDVKRKLLLVNNWGNISNHLIPGTGRSEPPSITMYPLEADGDTAPVRVIQGPKTQLNWPAGMSLDPDTGDLFVANDLGDSVLVFRETDQGDVPPRRVIKGDKTGLRNPSGVSVDTKNKELWVVNLGNSSATVYPLNASGNRAPLRTIRSAPEGKISLKFGKPSGVAYDSKREQLLVAN
jgi:DNA-binding beta-propeller fold protein YncE